MSLGALRLAVIINRQEEAVIAICMNHIQEAVHHIAVRHTVINHTAVLLRAVQAVITAINQILQTNHHIAVVLNRYDRDSDYADGVDDAMDELGEDW